MAFGHDTLPLGLRTPSRTGAGRSTSGPVRAGDRWAARKFLKSIGTLPLRIVLWDGREVRVSDGPLVARLVLRNRAALLRLLARPDLEFGECYTDGSLIVEGDLIKLLEGAYHTPRAESKAGRFLQRLGEIAYGTNGMRSARYNIHHHYDLGNDFYRLWLDRRMLYSCAYFPQPDMSLEQAQVAKLDHVCRKLQLEAGQTAVEVGCGWGSLALHMAGSYGVSVKAYNISHEQIVYAREQAKRQGLSASVEFIEDDYRNIRGSFDALASVGMLEHVGLAHYQELGSVIRRCLKPGGRGLIHSIGRHCSAPLNAWIRKRIFPGTYVPTLGEMGRIFEPHGFAILDVENLRLHYARTLEHWLKRFEGSVEKVAEIFDEKFVRAWRLYLAGSVVAFRAGSLQLFQVLFTDAENNLIPWSRASLYRDD